MQTANYIIVTLPLPMFPLDYIHHDMCLELNIIITNTDMPQEQLNTVALGTIYNRFSIND